MRDVAVTAAVVAVSLVGVELVARRLGLAELAARKALHVVACLSAVLGAVVADYRAFVVTGLVFTGLMAATRFLPLATLASFRRESRGEIFFPAGTALTALIAPGQRAFIVAMLILGLADTAAALIGRRFQSPSLVGTKTLAGSLAFLVTAGVLASFAVPWPQALAVAAASAAAEALCPRGSDNLSVPVVAALGFAVLA